MKTTTLRLSKLARAGLVAAAMILPMGGGAQICNLAAQAQEAGSTEEQWCCCGACCGWSVSCDAIPGCLTC